MLANIKVEKVDEDLNIIVMFPSYLPSKIRQLSYTSNLVNPVGGDSRLKRPYSESEMEQCR